MEVAGEGTYKNGDGGYGSNGGRALEEVQA
jgi:hypothetical protein